MNKMKVMMLSDVYPPLIGGQEREVQLLSEGMAEKGHQVTVCTLDHGVDLPLSQENGVKIYRLKGMFQRLPYLYHNPARKFHPPARDWILTRTLRAILQKERPDIIHANGWILYSVLPILKTGDIPLCVTFHDYGFICPQRWSALYLTGICNAPLESISHCLECGRNDYGPVKSLLTYHFLKFYGRFTCDILVFTNPNTLEKMRYLQPDKIYLPHPIDTNKFFPMVTKEHEDRILIWATLNRFKGIDTSFEVAKRIPDYQFDVMYIGDDREYFRSRKPDNVSMLPGLEVDEVPEFLNRYPLVIGQFVVGAFGHAELEAMSCGKPVIAFWDRKYDAFYDTPCPILSSRNVQSIVDLVRSSVGDKKLGSMNRDWIMKNHSAPRVIDHLLNIYESIMK